MIFASCSTSTSYDDKEIEEKTNTEVVEDEPKEDDTENNTEEPSNEKKMILKTKL